MLIFCWFFYFIVDGYRFWFASLIKKKKNIKHVPNQLHAEFPPPPQAEMGTEELGSKFMYHTV